MASAIQRMDTSSSTITSNHVNLVRLCVETDSTASAIPVLDKDIHTYTSNPPTSSDSQPPLCTPNLPSNLFIQRYHGVTSAITLELVHDYYIHGAICYMDMDNWSRAAFLLETVLSTPSRDVANYAMLEAYKKWVLVKLLHEGKVGIQKLPTSMSADEATTGPWVTSRRQHCHTEATQSAGQTLRCLG